MKCGNVFKSEVLPTFWRVFVGENKTIQNDVNQSSAPGLQDKECDVCRQETEMLTLESVLHEPVCLLILVNRFDDDTKLRFEDGVIFRDVLSFGGSMYSLVSALCHSGLTAASGHNTTVAYHSTFDGGKWLLYNDCQVCLFISI